MNRTTEARLQVAVMNGMFLSYILAAVSGGVLGYAYTTDGAFSLNEVGGVAAGGLGGFVADFALMSLIVVPLLNKFWPRVV